MACNKGTPPAIGVGLMKRLARDFVVALTPEHCTSKTCVACGGLCGAYPTLKTKTSKEIRGLRVCQHEGCGLLQNRDRTGATNIGRQFARLVRGQPPLRPMSGEELEFHRLRVGVECDGGD
jgi:transposase